MFSLYFLQSLLLLPSNSITHTPAGLFHVPLFSIPRPTIFSDQECARVGVQQVPQRRVERLPHGAARRDDRIKR